MVAARMLQSVRQLQNFAQQLRDCPVTNVRLPNPINMLKGRSTRTTIIVYPETMSPRKKLKGTLRKERSIGLPCGNVRLPFPINMLKGRSTRTIFIVYPENICHHVRSLLRVHHEKRETGRNLWRLHRNKPAWSPPVNEPQRRRRRRRRRAPVCVGQTGIPCLHSTRTSSPSEFPHLCKASSQINASADRILSEGVQFRRRFFLLLFVCLLLLLMGGEMIQIPL